LNEDDEYWLQLFPSRGIVSARTYEVQERKKDSIFLFPDGGMYFRRNCSLIKMPFHWNDEHDMALKISHYNMTVADIERGSWSIFPIVQEKIY
jgi:hypothetical protein